VVNRKNIKERAILAGFRGGGGADDDPYDELARLAETSGAKVVAIITQKDTKPTAQYFIGRGKMLEISEAVRELNADVVIFNNDLSPLQFRNLERDLDVKVIDRTQLILDIFAMRAQSSEGKIQVELAQLEYLLPRIAGHGNELSRLGGGIGTRGPGETKLEVDRRRIRDRISRLKKDLKKIEKHRVVQRRRRAKSGIPLVALVGYTNAGKTTLLNNLADEAAFVEDKLFATLDPLTRRIHLPETGNALLMDTVGFIRDLPVQLIEAFKSTMEGILEAGLLLHVVDISDPRWENHIEQVEKILIELGAGDIPVCMVLNKIDALDKPERLAALMRRYQEAVPVSARTDRELTALKRAISRKILDAAPRST